MTAKLASISSVPASFFRWTDWDDDGGAEHSATLSRETTMGFIRRGFLDNAIKDCFGLQRGSRCARTLYVLERVMVEYGRLAQILLLLLVGAVQIALCGLVYSTVWRFERADPRPEARVSRYFEGWWTSWTFMADGGTHSKEYHAEQRIIGGLIAVLGIIFMATVLAFIVDVVREKMNTMRVGEGQVYESNHIVILNWTDRTIPLLSEFCIANESEGGGVVVVLARHPIEVMRTELSLQLPEVVRRGTKIVLRHGNPVVISDLIKVCADQARAVVCLASGDTAGEADSTTMRCILSLKNIGYILKGHIVAEVKDRDSQSLMQLVGGKHVETFVASDVVSHLLLMSVRQPGLANVYDALLGFEGNEFYLKSWPELAGIHFGNLLERLPNAIPIGVSSVDGELRLNPGKDYQLRQDDQLIVIAEDDNTYNPEQPVHVEVGMLPRVEQDELIPERILICGWRHDICDVLNYLDAIVVSGSEVHVMTHCMTVERRNEQLREDGLQIESLRNIRLIHHYGNASVRRKLETLPVESYSSCLIFADQAYDDDVLQADSHSLATMVLIRDIQAQRQNEVTCPITCEILDLRTQRTLNGQKQLGLLSDFVHSNKFAARILAMIAESRRVNLILSKFLNSADCSLVTVTSSKYVFPEELVSFWTVAKRVQMTGAVLLGFQSGASSLKKTVLNPTDKLCERRWESYNLIIISGESVRGAAISGRLDSDPASAAKVAEHSVDDRGPSSTVQSDVPNKLAEAWCPTQIREHSESGEFHALDEGEICASADTAMRTITKLADMFARLRTESEQQRLGSLLIHLGQRLRNGKLTANTLTVSELLFDPYASLDASVDSMRRYG